MSKLPNKQQGFSIIEAMMAIIILMIAFVAVINIFPFSINITGDAQQQSIASSIALSKIEEIRSLNYENISTGTVINKQPVSSDPENAWHQFDYQIDIGLLDNNLQPSLVDNGLKRIEVKVFWRSPIKKTEQSIEISTIISNY